MSIGLVGLFSVFVIAVVLDFPIAVALALSALVYVLLADMMPLVVTAQRMLGGLDSFTLLAVPLFILAGGLLSQAGLTRRIIRVCSALVGGVRGGHAQAMVVAAMLFGALSGSGVADVVAIGTLMLPAMRERGYPEGFSCALLGCAGALGTVIPPSIVMIVYGVATGTSIGQLFVAGIVPGILMGLGLMLVAWLQARRHGWSAGEPFSLPELLTALRQSFLALMAPVIIVGGIRGGLFTPTEAGAAAVAYALVIGFFVTRELTVRGLLEELKNTAELTGAILFLVATASLFGWILTAERAPELLAAWLVSLTSSPFVVILLMLGLVLVLGTFMESIAIILMLAPIFSTVTAQFQIDQVHFGILIILCLAIGANTPPLGIDLMAACRIAKIPMSDSFRYLLPLIGIMTLITLLIAAFPWLLIR
jgi:tripartite ATP-independent transporter DctM subunit